MDTQRKGFGLSSQSVIQVQVVSRFIDEIYELTKPQIWYHEDSSYLI